MDYRRLMVRFLWSLCLCDHMGDVSNDILKVVQEMRLDLPDDVWDDEMAGLRRWLEEHEHTKGLYED